MPVYEFKICSFKAQQIVEIIKYIQIKIYNTVMQQLQKWQITIENMNIYLYGIYISKHKHLKTNLVFLGKITYLLNGMIMRFMTI